LAGTLPEAEERLDALVNNAGVEIIMPVERMNMDTFDLIWRVNVRAPVELTHLLLPLLRKAGGASVINVTSIHQETPYPNNSAYSMSKAALGMFTKTAALEFTPYGVRVNNLAPGAVETEINREVIEEIGRDSFGEWIPLGRVAQTDEMIGPALFLASDASSYVTGTTLYADGGHLQNLVRYRPEPEQYQRRSRRLTSKPVAAAYEPSGGVWGRDGRLRLGPQYRQCRGVRAAMDCAEPGRWADRA
jgi:NAD(P)-dependent dehydrogenase (short-subunit alcohol dehydrogenase family)